MSTGRSQVQMIFRYLQTDRNGHLKICSTHAIASNSSHLYSKKENVEEDHIADHLEELKRRLDRFIEAFICGR